MATDRHTGRQSPVFVIEGNPQKYNTLIENHGTLARVMRARKCPCITNTGSPSIFCKMCHGDGFIHEFQRKFLAFEEDADVRADRSVVYPYIVPILEPISVERMLAPEQGGIKKYTISSFNASYIKISGDPLPLHWHKMKVSYYFDGYTYAENDYVEVNQNAMMLTATKTRYDGKYRISNVSNIHGDIAEIKEIKNIETGYVYKNYTYRKNVIQLHPKEPKPEYGKVVASYYYVPPVKVMPQNIETTNDKEKWTTSTPSGTVSIALKYWYELSEGDLISLLSYEMSKDAIISHNAATSIDRLNDFDIVKIDDEIIDEDGIHYVKNIDFVLMPYRDILWIGKQPVQGKKISVRYVYRPTYTVFMNNPSVNALENKKYATIVNAKLFQMMYPKDIELKSNPKYEPDTSNSKITGFTDL